MEKDKEVDTKVNINVIFVFRFDLLYERWVGCVWCDVIDVRTIDSKQCMYRKSYTL